MNNKIKDKPFINIHNKKLINNNNLYQYAQFKFNNNILILDY